MIGLREPIHAVAENQPPEIDLRLLDQDLGVMVVLGRPFKEIRSLEPSPDLLDLPLHS